MSREQDKREAAELAKRLVPVTDLSNLRNGWMAPDGQMFTCDAWAHDWLIRHLEKLTGFKEERFIKLSRGVWTGDCPQASVKQIDRIWDWCEVNGEDFPEWLIEDDLYKPRKRA